MLIAEAGMDWIAAVGMRMWVISDGGTTALSDVDAALARAGRTSALSTRPAIEVCARRDAAAHRIAVGSPFFSPTGPAVSDPS